MTNFTFIFGFVCAIAGVFTLSTVQTIRNNQAGIYYDYEDLRNMKAECEKDLPRSTECSIVVYYLPQASPEAELEEKE